MLSRRAFLLLILSVLLFMQQVYAQVAPVEIDTGVNADECSICGMPIRDLRFSALVFYNNGEVLKIDDMGEIFDNLPEIQTNKDVTVLVADYYTLEWINGKEAYYVKGGNVYTPMGYNIVAFNTPENAERFIAERGGVLLSFHQLTPEELEPGTMMMPGIPNSLFLGSIFVILFVTFGMVEYWERRREKMGEYPRYDLLRIDLLKKAVGSRKFQFFVQVPIVFMFFLIILAGLFGVQEPSRNIATILTWIIWWVVIVFIVIFAGKVWCTLCPWNAVSDWIRRLSFWKRKRDEELFTLNLRWPRKLRNIYLATLLFLVLTWLELGFGVTSSPRATAYLALLILSMAIVPAVIFEGKPFCRYACLVGRVSGLYSMFASSELRSRSKEVCRRCRGKDCWKGNERGYPCPTFQNLSRMDVNTYCILCTECIKSCRHNNVSFNIRPFATDLIKSRETRKDEAYLSLVMLSMTTFHGVTMTPQWFFWTVELQEVTGLGYYGVFTLLMMAILLALPAVYYVICWLSKIVSGNKEIPLKKIFINYAYPILPIALFYHLAHNTMHFFREAQKVLPVLSDPFGWEWNLFGTANISTGPLLSLSTIWYIQVVLVVIGHIFSIYVASRIARRTFDDHEQAFWSLIPQLLVLVGYSAVSLWLIAQPMVMRTAM